MPSTAAATTRRSRAAVILGAIAIVLLAVQFVRPAISHPPVQADLAATPEVKQILRTPCYDCHSNETRLAWFDEIVPAYWLVASDVKNARARLNFSDIGSLPAGQQKAALFEAFNQVQLGAMPLPAYTRLHRDAIVTPAQLDTLRSYLNPPAPPVAASAADLAADDAQYRAWMRQNSPGAAVRPALNGFAFLPDYRNWTIVSATDRFDNQSMRVILGNAIGARAVAEGRIDPWPDGAAFAKIAWSARDDGSGNVRAGSFIQVEFMLRDKRKYAATLGWGWGRWRGLGLTPYGKDTDFSSECVGCHTPVRNSDYVYTMPLRAQPGPPAASINETAVLGGSLPWNPLRWNVIAPVIDTPALSA